MIINASSTNLLQASSNLPNLSNPIGKWFLPVNFILVTKTITAGEVVETETSSTFQGVVQNLNSKELQIKPEAQRGWTWKMIHALPSLQLNVDDIIKYENINYRVMNVKDWKEYGYMDYHIVVDYTT